MTKQEIAEQFNLGNKTIVLFQLRDAESMTVAMARAFDVYQFIRGQYGAMKALEFSNWLQTFSDL